MNYIKFWQFLTNDCILSDNAARCLFNIISATMDDADKDTDFTAYLNRIYEISTQT